MNFIVIFNIFIYFYLKDVKAELCPLIFGEYECPLNYECKFGVCKDSLELTPPNDCFAVLFCIYNLFKNKMLIIKKLL